MTLIMLHLHVSDQLAISISLLFCGSVEARWQLLPTPGWMGKSLVSPTILPDRG